MTPSDKIPEPLEVRESWWSVDSIVVRDQTIFSYGWCARVGSEVMKAQLDIEYENGEHQSIPVEYGNNRADVVQHFPNLSETCGYMLFSALSHAEQIAKAMIVFEYTDGHVDRFALSVDDPTQNQTLNSNTEAQLGAMWTDTKKAVGMLVRGQTGAFIEGVQRRAKLLLAKKGGESVLNEKFESLKNGSVLLIDHALGGGTNKFSKNLIERYVSNGADVVVWTFLPSLLRFQIRIHRGFSAEVENFYVPWESHSQLLTTRKIGEVVFNNCVSFTRPQRVADMMVLFNLFSAAKITTYIHDFNVVCPSPFLLDDTNKYCGVPNKERCRTCLPKINTGFVSLYAERDIDVWRSHWLSALSKSDEIVCFSKNSSELLRRAYPSLAEEKIVVRPHTVSRSEIRYYPPIKGARLKIGVVGHISVHKGSVVVQSLAEEIKKTNAPIDIVIVGTLLGANISAGCEQTGAYESDQLGAILTQNAVNVVLMPSICAETFSFVTHELIDLGIPVLCFDLGAQAEAVRAYSKGCVVPVSDGPELLRYINQFARDELDIL